MNNYKILIKVMGYLKNRNLYSLYTLDMENTNNLDILERVRQNLKENYYWMMIKYDLKIF
jgi:hypothetical protein